MSQFLILAQNSITADALAFISKCIIQGECVKSLVYDGEPSGDSINDISMSLEALSQKTTTETFVIVDQVCVGNLSPMESDSWKGCIAALILLFPEVKWIFAVPVGIDADDEKESLVFDHGLASLRRATCNPLFDGMGLRSYIRNLLVKAEDRQGRLIAPYIPLRQQVAVSMDDEPSYAYFNAYVAYRFGFRAFPVVTDAQAKALFHCDEADVEKLPAPASLTFEDICISYPDGSDEVHYSDLCSDLKSSRINQLPLLDKSDYRIFVTTQHRQVGHPGKNESNKFYIDSGDCVKKGTQPNRYGKLILKPYSGMFDLWRRARLDRKLRWRDDNGNRFRRGVGQGYVWPPQQQSESDGDTGHSAPGRLLMIATHMIKRCEKLLPSVKSVEDAVLCAVLATDALELLGNRTPTTAMDALRLKHLAEVKAECQFSGVEYKIEMKARLKELRRDAEHIGRWFDRRRQKMAAMNAEMTTLVDILKVLKDHGQFDESHICGNRIRELHFQLWMRQQPWRNVFRPFLWYFNIALKSFPVFTCLILFWLAAFTFLFHLTDTPCSDKGAWFEAFQNALTRFLDFKASPDGASVGCCIVTFFASIMKITHVGLFFSLLMNNIQRKD
jgi:hypothetical protein